jgi:hypothetical protein
MSLTSKTLLQSRSMWAAALLFSLLAVPLALNILFTAYAELSVAASFSKEQALAAAADFRQQQFPELETDRQAAAFLQDKQLQNYVELEGGGTQAFQQWITIPEAASQYWMVRNFKAAQEQELLVYFNQHGRLLGFKKTIPQQAAGPALAEAAARVVAENGARAVLANLFAAYVPLEVKQTVQSSGRVDHEFIYENIQYQAGEARFRLRLVVAGEQLIAVVPTNFIPESFKQRFGEMRALNTQISNVANVLGVGAWGLSVVVAGIWLHRRQLLQWRQALIAAAVVGGLLAATQLAGLSIRWMNYQTTASAQNFLSQQVVSAGLAFLLILIVAGALLAVAEGLTRLAFAEHPRFFELWRPQVAGTAAGAGRVLGAYVLIGPWLLYVALFVVLTSRYLGWWSPADTDFNPNILASWRPALAPIANSLQAGVLEESLFRAVPLALAALLGRRIGKQRLCVGAMLVLQALVFAGAHANYPNLPGYSRLVEIFLPALMLGLIYLRCGLWVGIIAHFEYDLVLMSLPLFTATATSLWFDRMLVIAAGAVPLVPVLIGWARQGQLLPLAAAWFNGAYRTPSGAQAAFATAVAAEAAIPARSTPAYSTPAFNVGKFSTLAVLVVAAVVLAYSYTKPARLPWPEIQVDRAQAEALAEQALAARGVHLSNEWHHTTRLLQAAPLGLHFVWRESGAATAQQLLGTYVGVPMWVLHWRRFEGPVESRSEAWQVFVAPDGHVARLRHQLPEANAGASLSVEQAQQQALAFIGSLGWGDVTALQLQSAREDKRPARSDWTVAFSDSSAYAHNDGRASISVSIAGDEVVDYQRFVEVPDAWQRAEREANAKRTPYRIAQGLFLLLLAGCGLSSYLRQSNSAKDKQPQGQQRKRGFSLHAGLPWVLVAVIGFVVNAILNVDARLDGLQTTIGYSSQIAMTVAGQLFAAGFIGVVVFLGAQALYGERPLSHTHRLRDFQLGLTLAVALVVYRNVLTLLAVPSLPYPPILGGFATAYPALAAINSAMQSPLAPLMILVIANGLVRFAKSRLQLALVGIAALALWLASAASSAEFVAELAASSVTLVTFALCFWLIKRQYTGLAIAAVVSYTALNQLNLLRASYAGAGWHAVLSVLVGLGLGWLLLKHWYRNGEQSQ